MLVVAVLVGRAPAALPLPFVPQAARHNIVISRLAYMPANPRLLRKDVSRMAFPFYSYSTAILQHSSLDDNTDFYGYFLAFPDHIFYIYSGYLATYSGSLIVCIGCVLATRGRQHTTYTYKHLRSATGAEELVG